MASLLALSANSDPPIAFAAARNIGRGVEDVEVVVLQDA